MHCCIYQDCSKTQYLSIIFKHLNEVFLWRLGDEGKARLLAVFWRSKSIVWWQLLVYVHMGVQNNTGKCTCVSDRHYLF